jgi:putative phage-type endonuclease
MHGKMPPSDALTSEVIAMDYQAFLEDRKQGIGGSDAACALALDEYRTPRELYGIKTGELPDDFSDNRFTRAGRVLESAIANLYAEQFGVTLRKKLVPMVHPRFPFMRGWLDRTIVGVRAVLEIKNVDGMVFRKSGEWGEPGSDQVPLRYLVQCAHYLAITGYPVAFLGALVGGNDLKRYVIERDLEFEEELIEGEHGFWQHVVKREPPPLDYAHPSALGLVKRLYPGSGGRIIELPNEANELHLQVIEGRELEKQGKAMQDEAKAHLLELMKTQGASIGRLSTGGEYRYSKVHRNGYEVEATDYERFQFCVKQTKLREVA